MILPSRPLVPGACLYFWPRPMVFVMRLFLFLTLVLLAGPGRAAGPVGPGPVKWSFGLSTEEGRTYVELTGTCEEGWHFYALELPRDDGPLPTLIRTTPDPSFTLGPIMEPAAEEVDDPNFGMRVRYHSGTATFRLPVERLTAGTFQVSGEVEFMACNDRTCLPPEVVRFSVSIPASPSTR